MRERNKFSTVSTNKKTGERTEMQPLDRKYAVRRRCRRISYQGGVRAISSDIVLVAETPAQEEDGWRIGKKTE